MSRRDSEKLVVLDPSSGPLERRDDREFKPRPKTLDGAVLGLVANGLGRGEKFLDALYAELAEDGGPLGAVRVLKHSVSVPPEPSDWARLTSEATLAIAGVGG